MIKQRWMAIVLTIVMLTTYLSPVCTALAQADTTDEAIVSEPAVSAAIVQESVAPATASSSGDASANVPVPVSEPAPVSEPVQAPASAEAPKAEPAAAEAPAAPSATEAPKAPAPAAPETENPVSAAAETAAAKESTPESTNSSIPAEENTPSATEAPAKTEEPVSTSTNAPAATEDPTSAPSEEPIVTETPAATAESVSTSSEEPAATETPAPASTEEPAATEVPVFTQEPVSTEEPAATETPITSTEEPIETVQPAETPAATEEPAETAAPSLSPEESAEPSVTPEASVEPTESPEPAESPDPTVEPTATPVVPALNVTISMGPSYQTVGGSISASASFSGGMGDYQVSMCIYSPYSLESEKNAVYSEAGSLSLSCTPKYGGTHTAIIEVTDAAGQTAKATASVTVSSGFPESPSVWEGSVSNVKLTGIWNEDIIAIAYSQLGNREYESCFMVDEGGKPHYYTRYGHWFGSPYQDWCAMFVAFCLHYADISTNDYPVSAGCTTWKNILTDRSAYEKNPLRRLAECETAEEAQALWDAAYTPVSGDLVFFNRDGGEDPCHVGIVEYVADGQLHTIEGNADDAVLRLVYDLTDETIAGYANTTLLAERAGALPEDENAPVTALPESTIGYTVKKNVNLRSQATQNSDQLAQLHQPGTAVTVLSAVEGNTLWYQVEYEGITGYIRGDLLALEEPAETEAPEITPEVTPEPTVEPVYFCGLEVHVHDELCSDADGNIICELTVHEHDENCLIAPEATPDPTVEPIYFCGIEVHVHDELCSAADGNIICELTVHEHNDTCLIAPEATPEPTIEPIYFCSIEVHVHDELCSDADGNITCELTVHEHDDNCLIAPEATPEPTVEPVYYCGLEVHVHDELCSDADGNIICELTVHEHDDNCLIAPEATPEPTIEPVYFCGLEVHVHDALCSDADGNIICELTVHEHDDSCLIAPEATPEPTVEPIYYCGIEVHVHDELCSDADGNITCELTVHEHDENCLIAPEATPEPTVEPVYFCGLEVHVHDELCSDADGNIICELTVHEHDDSCLIAPEPTVVPVYFCGLEVHVHDELCSDADGNIICELTVHEHDDNCLIAPEATPEPTVVPVYHCGLEVHVHDELCSDADGNIICELTVHEHDDNCLIAPEATPEPTIEPVYYCGLEVHVHDELCSDADGNIICELTVHEHDDSCLIAPVPTVEPIYFCGLEVHVHDELCSDADGNIICELTVHEHDDSCLIAPEPTVEPIYFCGLEVHVHDELCSDAEGNIICELTVHEHDDSCLIAPEATPEPIYYCGLEVHVHDELCSDADGNIICELTVHEHDDSCLIAPEPTVEPIYYCGLEVHVHDELCSDADGNIICELTVHEHDETCLSPAALQLALTWDPLSAFAGETLVTLQAQVTGGVAPYAVQFSYAAPQEKTAVIAARAIEEPAESPTTTVAASGETASFTYQPAASGTHTLAVTVTDALGTQTQSAFSLQVAQPLQHETEADFLAAIAPAQLTGDARADIVAIAATQLGYTASATDFVVDESGVQHAYTRFGAWAQQPYAPWSAPFVQFCLHYAGIAQIPAADAAALAAQLTASAQYRAADAYVPLEGDVVFFDWDEDGLADHTGLVSKAYEGENGYTIETIEGDVDGAVITRMFVVDGTPSLLGFGQTAENAIMDQVGDLITELAALPTVDEVEEQLNAFYEADDTDGETAYLTTLRETCVDLYKRYTALDPAVQPYVLNIDKLMDLEWLWSSATLEEPVVAETVYYCYLDEHIHSEENGCYTEGTLTCKSTVHTHDESCTVVPTYYCGLETDAAHTHTRECIVEPAEEGIIEVTGDYYFPEKNGIYPRYYQSSAYAVAYDTHPFVLIPADAEGLTEGTWKPSTYHWNGKLDANYIVTYCADDRTTTSPSDKDDYNSYIIDNSRFTNDIEQRKIAAIIGNSYPFLTMKEVKQLMIADGVEGAAECTEHELIAATQWAVWATVETVSHLEYSDIKYSAPSAETQANTLSPIAEPADKDPAVFAPRINAVKEWLCSLEEPIELEVEGYTPEITANEDGTYNLAVTVNLNRAIVARENAEFSLVAGSKRTSVTHLPAGESSFQITLASMTEGELANAKVNLTVNGKHMQAYFFDSQHWQDMVGGNWEYFTDDLSFELGLDLIDVAVTKIWTEATDVESIEVQLLANGKAYGDPVKLSPANDWHYIWKDLKRYSIVELTKPVEQRTEISYTIMEVPLDGYYSSDISVSGFEGVQKVSQWQEVETFDGAGQYVLVGDMGALSSEYLEEPPSNWYGQHYFVSLAPVNLSSATLTEERVIWNVAEYGSGYSLESKRYPGRYLGSSGIITSQYAFNFTEGLLGRGTSNYYFGGFYSNGAQIYTNNLSKVMYFKLYKLVELSLPTAELNYVLTNTKIPEESKVDVSVTKQWEGRPDEIYPESVEVQLMQTDVFDENSTKPYGYPVTLNAENNWTYTWTGMPRAVISEDEAHPIVYTVVEVEPLEGYEVTLQSDEENAYAFTLTNTWNPEKAPLTLTKVEMGTSFPLSGAVFDVYLATNNVGTPIPGTENAQGVYMQSVASGSNGSVVLELPAGETYYLVETKAPAGYNLPVEAIGFTLTKTDTGYAIHLLTANGWVDAASGAEPTLTVENKPGFELPETGSTGTLPYTAGGLLISATASLLLYIQFKRRREGSPV